MEYLVKTITSKEQIMDCDLFSVNHFKWKSLFMPKTYGRLGFIKDKGLYLTMSCEEKNPKRECITYHENLCKDSAMEGFFAFPQAGAKLSNDVLYINYEMNANGMLYAKYGKGRNNRKFISDKIYELSKCKTFIHNDYWSVETLIPKELLKEVGVWDELLETKEFYCNFYKISVTKELEHYGMFCPILSDIPNFHLPEFFSKGIIIN